MLSFESLSAQEGQIEGELRNCQSSSPRCIPMGFLRTLRTSFNAVAELQTEGPEVRGMAPGGKNAVESKLDSNAPDMGVIFTEWLTRLKALYHSQG